MQPMEFISIDLISEFHPPSSKGNRYTLTAANNWKYKFNPDHVKDIIGSAQSTLKQRSHPMELRSRDK